MQVTLNTMVAENALKMVRAAQGKIAEEYELSPETNTFGKELPEWVALLSADLHAAHGHLINAIDPNGDREHGWWNGL